ncbi:MAG TPA: acyltransferase family protein, partial [Steroidobacteraceae bacterium]|nr:acyltransferase family protein [Steroidobacteraceae bacterium]
MQTERLSGMDAVRAFALLSGVVLHAAMSFMPGLAAFGFPADVSQSSALQIVFYFIHVFRMPLFFFLAGYFGHLVFHRKGTAGFARDRAKRIALPLLIGWAAFGPMMMGLIYINLAPAVAAAPPAPSGLPLSHLWFLYYLLLIYLGAIGLRALALKYVPEAGPLRNKIDLALQSALRRNVAPLFVAAPVAACLYFTTNWMMWGGIPTPDTGLMPQRPALVAYGVAFVFGWLMHRQNDVLRVLSQRWALHLCAAVSLTMLSLWLVGQANPFAVPSWIKLTYAVAYTLAAWSWVFGLVGVGLRFFSNGRPVVRYLADSSYWVYLAHLPLVFALQLVVLKWPLHWAVKFPLIVSTALALLLLSYHFVVRNTVIGEVLNGRRYSKQAINISHPVINLPLTHDRCVAELRNVTKAFGPTNALEGVSLQVRRGEVLALLGPNGAGKSTAISLLLGLHGADSGEVTLFGHNIANDPVHGALAREHIGVMLQEVALPAEMCAGELIELVSSYYANALSSDQVQALTSTCSLWKRRYGGLSGGQQRLTQFAIAVCGRPQLLFLDEPTTGLDVEARETLWNTVRQLVADGCSVVLTTHYLEEAEALADRIVVLGKGRVLAEGTMEEIRSVVSSKRVSCVTSLNADVIRRWANIASVNTRGRRLEIATDNAESLVRRLLSADPNLRELEVSHAGLADAFV